MVFRFPTLKSVFSGLVVGFFLIQIVSVLISSLFPSVAVLKGGTAILLLLLVVAIIALFNIGFNLDTIKRETLIYVIILVIALGGAYYYLPQVFPQLFSISPEFSNSLRSSISSIVGGLA